MSVIVRFPSGSVPFAKHGEHDQKTHGSWATGSSTVYDSGVHVAITGGDPMRHPDGVIHFGDELAAGDRLLQAQFRPDRFGNGYSPYNAEEQAVINRHVLHDRPLQPKWYKVELVEEPMNTPDTPIPDAAANLFAGNWRIGVSQAEARKRGWDGDPRDIDTSGQVKVKPTQQEWRDQVNYVLDVYDPSRTPSWDTYEKTQREATHAVWNKIEANGGKIGAIYYRNAGERTSRPSVVAPVSAVRLTPMSAPAIPAGFPSYSSRFVWDSESVTKHGHHDQRSHGSWANGSSGDFQVVVGNEARAALASKIPAGDSPAHEQIRKALTSEIHMGETFVNSKPGEAIVSFDEDGNVNGAMSFITRDQKKDFYILNTGSLSSGVGTKMVRQLQSRAVAEDRGIILIPDTDTGSEAFWGKMGFHQSYGVWAMSSSQIKSLDLQPVTKHGEHDQKTHGSWASGHTGFKKLDPETLRGELKSDFIGQALRDYDLADQFNKQIEAYDWYEGPNGTRIKIEREVVDVTYVQYPDGASNQFNIYGDPVIGEATLHELQNQVAYLQSMAPQQDLVVEVGQRVFRRFGEKEATAFAAVKGMMPNNERLTTSLIAIRPNASEMMRAVLTDNWHMKSANPNNYWSYLVAHEYGHLLEPQRDDTARQAAYQFVRSASDNSQYGRTAQMPVGESFAEAFAEWVMTDGTSRNSVVQYFAPEFPVLTGVRKADQEGEGYWVETPTGGKFRPAGSPVRKHGSLRGKNYWRYHPNSTTAKLPDGTVVYSPKAALDAVRNGERPNILPSHAKAVLEEAALAKDDPDLTEIHVVEYKHFDVYGDENWGIARDKMPQVPVDQKGAFLQAMAARGVTVERGLADPIELKPVQKEISARKAGQIMQSIEKNGMGNTDADRLIVSSDGWVVDGHHRWAAATGLEFGKKGAGSLPVFKVGMTAKELLPLLVKWNDANGIARIGMGQDAPSETGKEFNKAVDDVLARQGVAAPLTKSVVIRVPLTPEGVEFMKHLGHEHDQKTHGAWANGQYSGPYAEWGARAKDIEARENVGPTTGELSDAIYQAQMAYDEDYISDDDISEYIDNNDKYQDEINARVEEAREQYRLDTIEQGYEETDEHFWEDFDEEAVREKAKQGVWWDASDALQEERNQQTTAQLGDLQSKFAEVFDYTHTGTTRNGEEITIEARVEQVGYEDGKVSVEGFLYEGDSGNRIGRFVRTVFNDENGDLAVENVWLEIEDESTYGGTGFSHAFNKRNEDYYISHGVANVYVHAGLSVGGYAWAAQGFDWQRDYAGNADTGTVIGSFAGMLSEIRRTAHPKSPIYQQAVRMEARLNLDDDHPDFPTPYELSQFGRDPSLPKYMDWPGKSAMLNTNWYGVKPLTPEGRRKSQTEINYERASSKQMTFDFTAPAAVKPRDGDGDGKVLEGTTFQQWYDQFLGSGKN